MSEGRAGVRAGDVLAYPKQQPRVCQGTAVDSWKYTRRLGMRLFALARFEQQRPGTPAPSAGELRRQPNRSQRENESNYCPRLVYWSAMDFNKLFCFN